LVLAFYNVAVAISHFVAMEVCGIDTPSFFRLIANVRHGSFIAVFRMEVVIHVPMEVFGSVEPGAGADKDASVEPFRTVVAGRSTGIWRNVIVTVRAVRRDSDLDADLSGGYRGGERKSHPQCRCQ
jgi:hypothetical protein